MFGRDLDEFQKEELQELIANDDLEIFNLPLPNGLKLYQEIIMNKILCSQI